MIELKEEDLQFQFKFWKFQKKAQIVLLFFLALASLGVFGGDSFLFKNWQDKHHWVSLPFLSRVRSDSEWNFTKSQMHEIQIPWSLISKAETKEIKPKPHNMSVERDVLKLSFDPPTDAVQFTIQLNEWGYRREKIAIDKIETEIQLFAWP